VIPRGIDISGVRHFAKVDINFSEVYILYVGRLEARKGAHLLAHALKKAFSVHPDAQVVLIGHDTPYMESSVAKYV